MGLFDNITGFFTGQTAQDAANAQTAGLRRGYSDASGLLGQGRDALINNATLGRDALTTNYTQALQPFLKNYDISQGGTKALTDALGITGDPSQVSARLAQTPGYQFQLEQGNENVLRNASRTGGLASGGVNLDLQKQGQGLAQQTYQQYIQNLLPFLGQSNTAAAGIGGIYGGLGSGLANNYGALGGAVNQSFGTQGNAAYGTATGEGNAQASAELARNSGVSNLMGLGMNIASLAAGGAGAGLGAAAGRVGSGLFGNFTNFLSPGSGSFTPSDERIKEDIAKIGELHDGLGVYSYRYVGDETPRIGLIAQEVEGRYPDAVKEFGGIKAVDYGKATQFASKLAEFL